MQTYDSSSKCPGIETSQFIWSQYRSRCSLGFLKKFTIFTGKHLCLSLFLINLQSFVLEPLFHKAAALCFGVSLIKCKTCSFIKKKLQRRGFPVSICFPFPCKNFKNTYFEDHLRTVAFVLTANQLAGFYTRTRKTFIANGSIK